ncbi:MAG: CoA-binding protein [Pyrinomonadaceae bacterium]
MNSKEELEYIFGKCRTIAVVGLSSNHRRPSNAVAAFMQEKGYRIIPVNPFESEVLGERAFPDLESVGERIDLVDVFRRSEAAGEVVDEAIRLGIPAIWLQEGVIDLSAATRAAKAGLKVVMDLCWLKEWYGYGQ